jgi:hypothetical protein
MMKHGAIQDDHNCKADGSKDVQADSKIWIMETGNEIERVPHNSGETPADQ